MDKNDLFKSKGLSNTNKICEMTTKIELADHGENEYEYFITGIATYLGIYIITSSKKGTIIFYVFKL